MLLVDDDQLLSSIIARRFAAESFLVEQAGSAEEALQMLQKEGKPDLLLLDIHLPGMNGFDFLEKLRATPGMEHLPVIVLSNFVDPEDVERSKQFGVLQHIQKVSMTPAEVVETVKKTIQEHRK